MTKYINSNGQLIDSDNGCNTTVSGILYQSYSYSENDNLRQRSLITFSKQVFVGATASRGNFGPFAVVGDSPFASKGYDPNSYDNLPPPPGMGAEWSCDTDPQSIFSSWSYPTNTPSSCVIANRENRCLTYPNFESSAAFPMDANVRGFVSNSHCNGFFAYNNSVGGILENDYYAPGPCAMQAKIVKNTYKTTIEVQSSSVPCYENAKASDFCDTGCEEYFQLFGSYANPFPQVKHVAKSPAPVLFGQVCNSSECGQSCDPPMRFSITGVYYAPGDVGNKPTDPNPQLRVSAPYSVNYSIEDTIQGSVEYSFIAPDCKDGTTICSDPCYDNPLGGPPYGTPPFDAFYSSDYYQNVIQEGSRNVCLCMPEEFICDPLPGETSCNEPGKVPRSSVHTICETPQTHYLLKCKYKPSDEQKQCYHYEYIKLKKDIDYCGDAKNNPCAAVIKNVEYNATEIIPIKKSYPLIKKTQSYQTSVLTTTVNHEVPSNFTTPYIVLEPFQYLPDAYFYIWHNIKLLQIPRETITLTITVATCEISLSPCVIP